MAVKKSHGKGERPKPVQNTKGEDKQWDNFDKVKDKLFGPKKWDGSNRA